MTVAYVTAEAVKLSDMFNSEALVAAAHITTVLYCTVLYCIVLYCTALQSMSLIQQ